MNTEQEALFQEGAGRTARLLAYGLIAIVLMAADQRGHYLPQFRAWAGHVMIPLYEAVGSPFAALNSLGRYLNDQSQLQAQLQQLQQANLELRAQSLLLDQLRSENNQLRELLGAQQERALQVTYAELVQIALDPFSHRVVINRGSHHGIAVGQAVLDANGVFGQVERVSIGGAEVILISDPNHAMPVQIRRTGMRTLAYGTGNPNQILLPDLPLNTDIRPGDVIVTSGLGGHFLPGLPVATVVSTEDEGTVRGDFISALARPLAGLDRSSQLVVVTSNRLGIQQNPEPPAARQGRDTAPGQSESTQDTTPATDAARDSSAPPDTSNTTVTETPAVQGDRAGGEP